MDPSAKHIVNFQYDYTLLESDSENRIEHSVQLPFDCNQTIREYAFIIMKKHNLPEYLEEDLIEKFKTFVDDKIDYLQCNRVDSILQHRTRWLDKSKSLLLKIKDHKVSSNENKNSANEDLMMIHDENFYLMYHQIIHSGILTPQLIQLENHNSQVIRDLLKEKEEFIGCLTEEQNKKIEEILLNGSYSEREISMITKSNFQFAEKCRKEWNEKIASVRNDQRSEETEEHV